MSVLLHGEYEDPLIIPKCAVIQVSRDRQHSTVFWGFPVTLIIIRSLVVNLHRSERAFGQ